VPARTAYVIACQERTGSNLLCGAFSGTRSLGEPDEWIGRSRLHDRLVRLGLAAPESTVEAPQPRDFAAYIAALDATTVQRDVFGTKVHWYQLAAALDDGWVTGLADLVPARARGHVAVIRLRRRDRAAQAVSVLRAQQTGVYVAPVGGSVHEQVRHRAPYWADDPAAGPEGVYTELDRIVETLTRHDAAWDSFLAPLELPTLELVYEDLVDDYAGQSRRAIDFVSGESAWTLPVVPPRTIKQADGESAALVERYRAARPGAVLDDALGNDDAH